MINNTELPVQRYKFQGTSGEVAEDEVRSPASHRLSEEDPDGLYFWFLPYPQCHQATSASCIKKIQRVIM